MESDRNLRTLCFSAAEKHMNPVQVMLLAGILKVLVSFIGG